jgi:hypothetical protein
MATNKNKSLLTGKLIINSGTKKSKTKRKIKLRPKKRKLRKLDERKCFLRR